MDTVKENRYNNLLRLIEEAGSMVRLEERTGITANYLRQIKNKNAIQNGKPKGIGDKIAGKLEDGMGKPRGWLDQDHSKTEPTIYLQDNIQYLMRKKSIADLSVIADRLNVDESELEEFITEPDLTRTDLVQALANLFMLDTDRLLYTSISANPKGVNLLRLSSTTEQPIQEAYDREHPHRIDYLDVRAAAGMKGYSNADFPETIQSIWLSDDGMLELVGKRRSNGLFIVNVPTDSMEPTIPKGAPVILDTNTSGYTGEGIYAFSINGDLFIKRLQKRIKGGYLVISDNKPKYQDEEMESEYIDNAKFVGKFVRVWKIESEDL